MTADEPSERRANGQVRLRLYVAGDAPGSVAAIANLRTVRELHPALVVALEIIDVLILPERALEDGVLVTPMLVRLEPLPERRVLGSLRDRPLLLSVLGLAGAPDA